MNQTVQIAFYTNLGVVVFISFLLMLIPSITRKSYLFGVEIPPEEQRSSTAIKLRNRYRSGVLAISIALLVIITVQTLFLPRISLLLTLYYPFLIFMLYLLVYAAAWKATKAWKSSNRGQWVFVTPNKFEAYQQKESKGNPHNVPWVWYILSLLVIIVTIVFTAIYYPSLPDHIPTHFNAAMQPTTFRDKTFLTAFFVPVIVGLPMLAIMVFSAVGVEKSRLQIDPLTPAKSFAQHRRYRRLIGNGLGALTLCMYLMFFVLQLPMLFKEARVAWLLGFCLVLVILPTLYLLTLSIYAGQGGGRLKVNEAQMGLFDKEVHLQSVRQSKDEDQYWALGMFYHNPEDASWFVEDRFGNNLGLNYGRPVVKGLVIVGMILLITLYVYLTILFLRGM